MLIYVIYHIYKLTKCFLLLYIDTIFEQYKTRQQTEYQIQ